MSVTHPDPFLEVRCQTLAPPPPAVVGLCAGYDGGKWQADKLAQHLFQWLPYAALSQENQLAFGSNNFVEFLRQAAAHIYNTKKTASRGEIGELILHLCCILHFRTIPVMCKLVLKSSSNDTVKGFDGIHLLPKQNSFEIWLGESKFYTDPQDAIREAVKSVKEHIVPRFLNTEKAMVFGHIAPGLPCRDDILKLFKSQTSGDELLKKSVFPVLIAYDSSTVAAHKIISDPYVEALKIEIGNLKDYFLDKAEGLTLRFELIFVPLGTKSDVIDNFDKMLGAFL